jgi:hypothetical protein
MSGYLDLILTFLLPTLGLGFLLLIGFWILVRPSVPDSALSSWIVGILTLSAIVGLVNAVRTTARRIEGSSPITAQPFRPRTDLSRSTPFGEWTQTRSSTISRESARIGPAVST